MQKKEIDPLKKFC